MKMLCYGILDDGRICDPSDPSCYESDFMFISSSADSDNFSDTLVCSYLGEILSPLHVTNDMCKYAYMFFECFIELSDIHAYNHISHWADVWGVTIESLQYLI